MSETKRAHVAALSRELEDLLLEDQRRTRAPKGMAKCPVCGTIIAPTKTKRIRVHPRDPYHRERCEASGKPWTEYGKPAPRPRSGQDTSGQVS